MLAKVFMSMWYLLASMNSLWINSAYIPYSVIVAMSPMLRSLPPILFTIVFLASLHYNFVVCIFTNLLNREYFGPRQPLLPEPKGII